MMYQKHRGNLIGNLITKHGCKNLAGLINLRAGGKVISFYCLVILIPINAS